MGFDTDTYKQSKDKQMSGSIRVPTAIRCRRAPTLTQSKTNDTALSPSRSPFSSRSVGLVVPGWETACYQIDLTSICPAEPYSGTFAVPDWLIDIFQSILSMGNDTESVGAFGGLSCLSSRKAISTGFRSRAAVNAIYHL